MTQLDMEPSRAATATPFRRDDREILGRFAYTYDLKRAYQDGVFGHIQFQLVDNILPGDNRKQMEDIATAKAAERKLVADRVAGFGRSDVSGNCIGC